MKDKEQVDLVPLLTDIWVGKITPSEGLKKMGGYAEKAREGDIELFYMGIPIYITGNLIGDKK